VGEAREAPRSPPADPSPSLPTQRILERIQNVKPSFDASKWEAEAEDQARLVESITEFKARPIGGPASPRRSSSKAPRGGRSLSPSASMDAGASTMLGTVSGGPSMYDGSVVSGGYGGYGLASASAASLPPGSGGGSLYMPMYSPMPGSGGGYSSSAGYPSSAGGYGGPGTPPVNGGIMGYPGGLGVPYGVGYPGAVGARAASPFGQGLPPGFTVQPWVPMQGSFALAGGVPTGL